MRYAINQAHTTVSTVHRPTSSAILDPFRQLLHLPPRPPTGFTPPRTSTVVETLIDADHDGIGPISVSTACNHLFCYSVKYEHNNIGMMVVAGDCVQEALAHGRIATALENLHDKTLYFGPIVDHSLTSVVTPRSAHGILPSYVLHMGQMLFHGAITQVGDEALHRPPPLSLIRVKLNGWLPFENSVPTCIFQGGASTLMMYVAWDRNAAHYEPIRLV